MYMYRLLHDYMYVVAKKEYRCTLSSYTNLYTTYFSSHSLRSGSCLVCNTVRHFSLPALLQLPHNNSTYTKNSQDHLFFLHFNREHIKTHRPKDFMNSIGNDLFVHGSIDQDTDAPDNHSSRLHPIMLFLNVHHPRFQHDGVHHLFNVVVRVRVHGCTIQQYISRSYKDWKYRGQNKSAGRPRQHDVKPRSTAYIERRKEIPHHQTNASDQITKRHGQN